MNEKQKRAARSGREDRVKSGRGAVKSARLSRWERRRHLIQLVWTILSNSYAIGFVRGKIYQGSLKSLCVPGLNCYSCPGALGSCPIGALQAVLSGWKYQFSFYIVGFLMIVGALTGRLTCGFLCPFGFFQDLLHKVPFPKKLRTFRGDRALRFIKYGILVLFVVLLPMFLVDATGLGSPYFCKLICPAGTLEGGIPLVVANSSLQDAVGFLYAWKIGILVVLIILSLMIWRPFCKYLCPLGAVYSLFNPISLVRLRLDREKCVTCGQCAQVCPMNVEPFRNPDSMECIRCGRCGVACPTGALSLGLINPTKKGQL